MKSIIWSDKLKMELFDKEEPILLNKKSVKIRIKYSGICGTDLHVIKGNEDSLSNIIRGHEAVGRVVEIGKDVKYIKIGDRVVIDPNQYCGKCYYCRKGLTNFCENENGLDIAGVNCDGVFSEYFVCNEQYLYVIPHDMSWLQAVMIEPVACIYNNIKAAKIAPDDSVLILGSGPMGAISEIICKKISRLVVATEVDDYRRQFCAQYADHIYLPSELTTEEILTINYNRKFDVIIDTVGSMMEYALSVASKNARIIPIGMNKVYNFQLHPIALIENGIKLIGASEYNMLFYDTINMMKRFPEIEKLVTGIYQLDDYKSAFSSILGFEIDTKKKCKISEIKVVFQA